MNTSETLEITILDRNDEKPVFNQEEYEIRFPELEQIRDENAFRQISNEIVISIRDNDGVCIIFLILIIRWRVGSGVVSPPDFRSRGPGFKSHWRQHSVHDCTALHCKEPFIIILPLSGYDLNNVKRDVKHEIIIIYEKFVQILKPDNTCLMFHNKFMYNLNTNKQADTYF